MVVAEYQTKHKELEASRKVTKLHYEIHQGQDAIMLMAADLTQRRVHHEARMTQSQVHHEGRFAQTAKLHEENMLVAWHNRASATVSLYAIITCGLVAAYSCLLMALVKNFLHFSTLQSPGCLIASIGIGVLLVISCIIMHRFFVAINVIVLATLFLPLMTDTADLAMCGALSFWLVFSAATFFFIWNEFDAQVGKAQSRAVMQDVLEQFKKGVQSIWLLQTALFILCVIIEMWNFTQQ